MLALGLMVQVWKAEGNSSPALKSPVHKSIFQQGEVSVQDEIFPGRDNPRTKEFRSWGLMLQLLLVTQMSVNG